MLFLAEVGVKYLKAQTGNLKVPQIVVSLNTSSRWGFITFVLLRCEASQTPTKKGGSSNDLDTSAIPRIKDKVWAKRGKFHVFRNGSQCFNVHSLLDVRFYLILTLSNGKTLDPSHISPFIPEKKNVARNEKWYVWNDAPLISSPTRKIGMV